MTDRFQSEIRVALTRDELFGRHAFAKSSKTTFIAYRTNEQRFRDNLIDALNEEGVLTLQGGDVPAGTQWASAVRERIKKARLVVADVTGPSREVLVEIGVAASRPSIYVTDTVQSRERLPPWLRSSQMTTYEGLGLRDTVSQILLAHNNGVPKPLVRGKPAPDKLAFVRDSTSSWTSQLDQRLAERCRQSNIMYQSVDPRFLESPEYLAEVLNQWAYVFALDGGDVDLLAHFVLGDLAGRPTAGSGTRRPEILDRHGVYIIKKPLTVAGVMADSAAKLPPAIASYADGEDAAFALVVDWLAIRQRWLR